MNPGMWWKALRIIPRLTREEWDRLDILSRWLVASRAAVLVLTLISAIIAGLLAAKNGMLDLGAWCLLAVGLISAHATNNLINDLVDFQKGVDADNYFRTQYGPQALQAGFLSKTQLLAYAAVPAAVAVACGLALAARHGWLVLVLMAVGAVFVLFYTWPLKYIGLGEIAVILVWGPLMVGGGYFAITGWWDWNTVWASLPYALGATTVIFGKHIDKRDADRERRIYTLPVLLGEKVSRWCVMGMVVLQYGLVIILVLTGYFSPLLLIVFAGIFFSRSVWNMYRKPRPSEPPEEAKHFWPMWFVAAAFYHNRIFGMLYLIGLAVSLLAGPWFA